jgi:copper chaperone NosL
MRLEFASYGLSLGLILGACSTAPQPIQYGTDVCHTCKMTLVDNKFGAELVTRKGKVYKFDDMRCFLDYYNSGFEPADAYQHILVSDYDHPGQLIDGTNAFYVSSSEIRSPMDGQVAAFNSKSSMDSFKGQWKGIYLTWGEVTTRFK